MNRTLFVLHRIGIGGSITSMLNLLEFLKDRGCDIDLFLMEHEGIFLDRAKKAANLLQEDLVLSSVLCKKEKLIKKRKIFGFLIRLSYVAAHKIFGSKAVNKFVYFWRAHKFNDIYQNVIAFQENTTTEFVQYIHASNKIAWVHNDYSKIIENHSASEMQNIYAHFDHILCVSKSSMESMIVNINGIKDKTRTIYNTINVDNIRLLSKEFIFSTEESKLVFVSVGRFAEQKRFDRVIEVTKKLLDDGYDFCWYIVGDGELFFSINDSISAHHLGNNIKLLGAQYNPYPIMAAADYIVITSLYEAQPMVAIEALVLNKPVISTEFTSVFEVISDKYNGIICENSTYGIYSGLKRILDDRDLQESLSLGAEAFRYDNEVIVQNVLEILKYQIPLANFFQSLM